MAEAEKAVDEGRLVAGRYRLVERIGRGGMGTVWRSHDELLGRQVAVKRLHVSPELDAAELATRYERTRREAQAAARINHPNVVGVHDVVDDGGLPCIVMEYVPSATLGDVIKEASASGTPVPPAEAARIGRGMVAALRAAHSAGVLHRDVKPGNVLLGEDGRVVLTDFGIAVASGTSTLTKTGELVGSIDYLAPERVKGGTPGPASDLWALGATLYQALEGRPPFRKHTAVETAYAIAMDPLEPPRNAGSLAPLVEALLAKEPADRPSAEAVEQALRAPASEADTTLMGSYPAGPRPEAGTGVTAARAVQHPEPSATGPTAPAMQPTASATGPTAASPAPGAPPARKGRGRPVLWSAAAVVAAAVLAGGVLAAVNFGSDGSEAAPQSSGHKEGQKEGKPDGKQDGKQPKPSTSPSLPPPTVPPGFRMVHETTLDAQFPVPSGWTRKVADGGRQIVFSHAPSLVELRVNALDFAASDQVEHLEAVEADFKKMYPVYKRTRLQKTTFQGDPAAIWQCDFQGRTREYRAIDLAFGRVGGREYAIYLSAPVADWNRYEQVFTQVKDGFRRT